jgi:hypothetical protein
MDIPKMLEEIGRQRFIASHHHLISPWRYAPLERAKRDRILLSAQWERQHG